MSFHKNSTLLGLLISLTLPIMILAIRWIVLLPLEWASISPSNDEHHFQIFAIIDMDNILFLRNETIHEAFKPNIESFVTGTIKIYKEHYDVYGNKHVNESHNCIATPREHYTLAFDVVIRSLGSSHMQIRGGLHNFCPNQFHPQLKSKPWRSYN